MAEYSQECQVVHFKSDFNFLREHNGWRPGKMHLLLAPTNTGKSSWARSVIWDLMINNVNLNIGLYLSEESTEDFKREWSKVNLVGTGNNLDVLSEQDEDQMNWLLFEMWARKGAFSALIIDNATTSSMYNNLTNQAQAAWVKKVKKLAQELNVPVIIIAHTDGKAGTKNSLIEENHIRGDKTAPNLAEFLYVLQRFYVKGVDGKEVYYTTIRLLKHRGYECKNSLFRLVFNPPTATFQSDKLIPWEAFKNAFNNRLTL